jgi:hypothetical protein
LLAEEAIMAENKRDIKPSGRTQAAELLAAGIWASLRIQLLSHEGNPLTNLEEAKARVSELCGQKEGACWQTLSLDPNGCSTVVVNSDKYDMVIDVEGKDSSGHVGFYSTVVRVGCGHGEDIKILEKRPEISSLKADTVTLSIGAHRCVSRDDHRDRMGTARITRATAQQIPPLPMRERDTKAPTKKPASIPATILEGIAFFNLPKNIGYLIDARLEEECASTCPSLPFTWPGADKDEEISICAEPRERVVSLFFVDPCGKAVEPTDVLLDQEGRKQPLPTAKGGTYTLTGLEVGRLRLVSRGYRFRPDEIPVDERMNQAHVFEAIQLQRMTGSESVDEIVLEFAEKIKEGDHGSYRILTLEGKIIETLEAGSGQPVHYRPADHEPLMIQALHNGKVIEQVMHPGLKPA